VHDPTQPALNATAQAALYAELASGAETGWDYSSRWLTNITLIAGTAGLRTLNVKNMVPVDLNSILCEWVWFCLSARMLTRRLIDKNRVLMAQLYGKSNASAAARHTAAAAAIKAGVLDLFWNSTKVRCSILFARAER
jgi:alpha,alpha-trehalase